MGKLKKLIFILILSLGISITIFADNSNFSIAFNGDTSHPEFTEKNISFIRNDTNPSKVNLIFGKDPREGYIKFIASSNIKNFCNIEGNHFKLNKNNYTTILCTLNKASLNSFLKIEYYQGIPGGFSKKLSEFYYVIDSFLPNNNISFTRNTNNLSEGILSFTRLVEENELFSPTIELVYSTSEGKEVFLKSSFDANNSHVTFTLTGLPIYKSTDLNWYFLIPGIPVQYSPKHNYFIPKYSPDSFGSANVSFNRNYDNTTGYLSFSGANESLVNIKYKNSVGETLTNSVKLKKSIAIQSTATGKIDVYGLSDLNDTIVQITYTENKNTPITFDYIIPKYKSSTSIYHYGKQYEDIPTLTDNNSGKDINNNTDNDKIIDNFLDSNNHTDKGIDIDTNSDENKVNHKKYREDESCEGAWDFSDLDDSFAVEYITFLADNCVIKGFKDGKVKPNKNVTRAEFLKMVFLSQGIDYEGINTNNIYFSDIKKGTWISEAVAKAIELDVINTKNKYFRPNDGISRLEALKILFKIGDIQLKETSISSFFDVKGWGVPFVETAKELGIINSDNKTFKPNNSITRAESAKIIVNTFDLE